MKDGMTSGPNALDDDGKTLANEAGVLAKEVAAILDSPPFRRAPILSRLLRYLLDRTIAGEGDRLKAYTVAVDGLSRAADFDAQLDSYPRVQVVRLRKALETYYAENPAHAGPCIFLGAGSYRLRIADLANAYPGLSSRNDALLPIAAQSPFVALSPRALWQFPTRRLWGGLALSIVIVGLLGLAITASREAATARLAPIAVSAHVFPAPIAVIGSVDGAASAHEKAAVGIMSDGLRRSWVVRIRDETAGNSEGMSPPAYRIMLREAGTGLLDIELVDTRSGTILWTGTERNAEDTDPRNRMAPIIAAIAGPFGVIARAETARLSEDSAGSYACMLRYFAFAKSRDRAQRPAVAACLEKPVDDARLAASVVAVRSFFTLELPVWSDRVAQIATAEQLARRAAQYNADDAYAQFAMARLAYLQNRCAAGGSHGDRAVAANPYDSMVVTALAGLAAPCDNPRATEFLDRAYLIRNDNDIAMRGFLVLATLAQGREERLTELGFVLRPSSGSRLGSYLLTETLIAAAQGRTAEAKTLWSEFRTLYREAGSSDDDRLRTIVLSDPLRRRLLELLREKGVIRS